MRAMSKVVSVAAVLAVALCGFASTSKAGDAAVAKASVKGKVVKPDGTPAAGAEVRLMPRAQRPKGPNGPNGQAKPTADADQGKGRGRAGAIRESVAQGTTDLQGMFTLSDVPAGNYTLVARLKGTGNARQNVSVSGTSAADVTLTLKERPAGKKAQSRATAKGERAQAKAARRNRAPQS